MGINQKHKRKINVQNTTYVWYVSLDFDSPYHLLNIISEDKNFFVSCPIETTTPYLISKGTLFQKQKINGTWKRYLLPFSIPDIITPRFVSEIIVWATSGKNAILVEWNGQNIPV